MVPKTHRMRLTRTGWGVAATGKEKAQLRQVGAETAQTEAHCGQHLVTTLPDIRLKLAQAWVVQEKEKTEKGCKRNCVNDHRKRRMETDGNRQGIDRPTAGRLQEAGRHHRRERPPETTHQSNPGASAAGGTDRSSWI